MLARPLARPAALPQPALGADAPAPPLPVLGAPATPEAPPPPAATDLPALPPDPPALLAGIPPALTCPPTPTVMPAEPGAPPFCSFDVPPAAIDPPLLLVDPPLLLVDPPVPPVPEGPALLEPEQAIAQGRSRTIRLHARGVRGWPGCTIFFSLGKHEGLANACFELHAAASVGVESHAASDSSQRGCGRRVGNSDHPI